jgi:mannose-6-phosphate isomerase-like protein (cupin superfamily)
MNIKTLYKLITKMFNDESFEIFDEIKIHDIIVREPFKVNLILIDTEPIFKNYYPNREIFARIYNKIMDIISVMGGDTTKWDIRYNQRLIENKEKFPFEQEIVGDKKIRTFNENIDGEELVWHRDREDRLVEVLEGENWMVQMDNQLPVKMKKGDSFIIPEGVYHRVLKGDGQLKISITVL